MRTFGGRFESIGVNMSSVVREIAFKGWLGGRKVDDVELYSL